MPEALVVVPIRWGSLGPLLLASLAVMGSPGPATISLVAVASGITAALLAVPAIGSILIGISAAYILWLAYRIAAAPPLSEQTEASDAPSLAGGALLGVANPKAWVAIAAVFASAELADAATTDALAKVAVLTAMIIVINATWLAAGASVAPLLSDPRRARVVNAALAAVLIGATALTGLQ